jgi:hypothetical protein
VQAVSKNPPIETQALPLHTKAHHRAHKLAPLQVVLPSHRLGGATSNQWSAPCFVRITGVEFGLVAGMDRVRAGAWGVAGWH